MNWILVLVLIFGPDNSKHITHGFPTEQSCRAALLAAKESLTHTKEPAVIVGACVPAPKSDMKPASPN